MASGAKTELLHLAAEAHDGDLLHLSIAHEFTGALAVNP